MSTFAEKMVDFEIAVCYAPVLLASQMETLMLIMCPKVENEAARAIIPSKQGSSPEQTSVLEESILKLSAQLSTIARNQKYFRTRENRNFSTVKSTEGRIFTFSLLESGLIVTMAGLQVFIVKYFFQGARKGIL
jgi:hypothetical protein